MKALECREEVFCGRGLVYSVSCLPKTLDRYGGDRKTTANIVQGLVSWYCPHLTKGGAGSGGQATSEMIPAQKLLQLVSQNQNMGYISKGDNPLEHLPIYNFN